MYSERAVVPEIKCLANLIERYMFQKTCKCGNPDITGRQMHIIGYICKENELGNDVFQKDIETKLNVRPSTSTAMLKVLEKNGYIIRQSVSGDLRLKKLVLTDKANNAAEYAFTTIKESESRITDGIAKEELDTFFKVIDKMKSNLCINNDTKIKHH